MPGGAGEIEYVRVRAKGAGEEGTGWEAAHPRQVPRGREGEGCRGLRGRPAALPVRPETGGDIFRREAPVGDQGRHMPAAA